MVGQSHRAGNKSLTSRPSWAVWDHATRCRLSAGADNGPIAPENMYTVVRPATCGPPKSAHIQRVFVSCVKDSFVKHCKNPAMLIHNLRHPRALPGNKKAAQCAAFGTVTSSVGDEPPDGQTVPAQRANTLRSSVLVRAAGSLRICRSCSAMAAMSIRLFT